MSDKKNGWKVVTPTISVRPTPTSGCVHRAFPTHSVIVCGVGMVLANFPSSLWKITIITIYRVGSHVVSVRIHCTEKWRTSFHTDVLSKSK